MKRLKSTRSIFRAKLHTTAYLLRKTDSHIEEDLQVLDGLHQEVLSTRDQSTLDEIYKALSAVSQGLDYPPPSSANRDVMLAKVNTYKKQHRFLKYTTIEHACVHLCTVYEDLIRRIVLKYYEEDIRRLMSNKESLKNSQLVDLVVSGRNIHRTLAEKVVDDLMYGSSDNWHKTLQEIGMNIVPSQSVKELFLIRNCIIHNDKKVSAQLHDFLPVKYKTRKNIRLTVVDFDEFHEGVKNSATFIISEYNRLFPTNNGTWVGVDY